MLGCKAGIPGSIQSAFWGHLLRHCRRRRFHKGRRDKRNVVDSEGRRIWVERVSTCGEGRLSQRHVRCAVICVVYEVDLGQAFHVQCSFLPCVSVPRLEV